jgi:hypothetical protein
MSNYHSKPSDTVTDSLYSQVSYNLCNCLQKAVISTANVLVREDVDSEGLMLATELMVENF